jgi:hypothetical protein
MQPLASAALAASVSAATANKVAMVFMAVFLFGLLVDAT